VIQQGLTGFVDGEQFFDTIADDAIFEFLYTAPGWPHRVDGRENLMAIFSGYGNRIALRSADELVVHKSQDPRVVILEYAVHGTVLRTGLDYNNHFIPVITIEDYRGSENRSLARLHGLLRRHGSANRNGKLNRRGCLQRRNYIRPVGRIGESVSRQFQVTKVAGHVFG
jgi:uncharacterized protein